MLTVRMNWMDTEKSCSADVQLSKDSKDIPIYHRNKLYHHRAQVASMVRYQLATIQRELDGETDEHQSEEAKAAEAITALIKGQRYRDGKLYTCYIDGTSHEGCEAVTAYNDYCRHRLDVLMEANKDITALVPNAAEFDVSAIDSLLDEEAELAARSHGNSTSSSSGEDVAALRAELHKKIDHARKVYNDKATKCSRYLSSFATIRNAKLAEGFNPDTVVQKETPARSYSTSPRQQSAAEEEQQQGAEVAAGEEQREDDEEKETAEEAEEKEEEGQGEEQVDANNTEIIDAPHQEENAPAYRDGTVAMGAQ